MQEAAMRALSHEMGHALGLFHTHRPLGKPNTLPCECNENPDSSNGFVCGDLVADTPADPLGTIDGQCNYTGDIPNDPGGTIYYPYTNNIMSYYRYNCQNAFTPGQKSRMISVTLLQNAQVVQDAVVPADHLLKEMGVEPSVN